MTDDIKLIDFSEVYNTEDPHVAADLMISLIKQAVQKNTKTVKVPNRKKIIKPWITPGLLRCIRHRNNMHKKLKKSPDNEVLKTSFTRYRNYCNKLLKKIKLEYEKNELKKTSYNPKKLWGAINNITNRAKKKENSSYHLLTTSSTPELSVNSVNEFFANIGKNLAEKISDGLTESIKKAFNNNNNNNSHSMVLLPTDEDEVARLILSLRNECAVGWDGIPSNLLKRHINVVVPPLTYICNLALTTGKFPKAFKKSIIHPIYKGGDRDHVNNYRPIAVLPALSKILERIINNRLVNYLEKHNFLSPSQYGFRSGKSSSDAIHDLTNYIVTNLDNGQKVLGIFLDLAKAFDTVSVPILLRKMESLGIRGIQLQLFEDYLSGRTHHSCSNSLNNADTCIKLCQAEKVKYLGVIIDSTLRFHEHINTLNSRLRKLIYVFKTMRDVADEKLKKSVYFALAQSLLTYGITSWGGAPKTKMLQLVRTQRAILKVSFSLPYRYPTELLYKELKILTVRQLFIRSTLLKQHALLKYNPSLSRDKRRFNPVDRYHITLSTKLSKRFFCHHGGFLYNKINKIIPIFNLNKTICKKKITIWFQELNYYDTEQLLTNSI
ncbi:unnamed protein product [Parnassius mnemosyne]|uniref:Reverse transcriptase domain-containing protein n=1 Tax=Parnassius mnemosyne TaxID=213953 RepID=A0AAV1L9E0_9NEOP